MVDVPLEQTRQLGRSPIAGLSPAGVDVTGLPDCDAIAVEIARGDLGGVRAVDWQQVVDLSATLLREHGKHLRVAACLAYGLLETRGLKGLAVGLGVLADMVDAYWMELHPPSGRRRGRMMALEWLAEKTRTALQAQSVAGEQEDCALALAEATRLLASLSVHSCDAADAAWSIESALRTRHETMKRQADANAAAIPALTPTPTDGPAGASRAAVPERTTRGPGPALVAELADALEAWRERIGPDLGQDLGQESTRAREQARVREQALGRLGALLLKVADALRSGELGDPRAYVLQRVSIWLPVRVPPPSVSGRTELPGPPGETQAAIEQAMTVQDYAAAVAQCEDAAAHSLFWFDVHRISAQALDAMGHAAAARTVRAQTRALLERMPELAALCFSDGTPFASLATRAWLDGTRLDRAQREPDGPESRPAGLAA